VTFTAYVQHQYGPETRHALEIWADRLAAIFGKHAAKVLPMQRGRGR
jgi:hypothetical protein